VVSKHDQMFIASKWLTFFSWFLTG